MPLVWLDVSWKMSDYQEDPDRNGSSQQPQDPDHGGLGEHNDLKSQVLICNSVSFVLFFLIVFLKELEYLSTKECFKAHKYLIAGLFYCIIKLSLPVKLCF